MKKLFVPLALLILVAAYWRATSSRSETASPTVSTTPPSAPSAAVERRASSTEAPRPVASPPTHADVIHAFERKRLAAGNENAAPLPPPMEAFRDVPKTSVQSINDRPYHLLGANAVPRDRYVGSMGKTLLEENGFVVFEAKTSTWEQAMSRGDAQPVLVSPNGRVAIMTGTILVKVRDVAQASSVAAGEGLEVITVDADTRTAFLKPPEGYALLAGQKRLQNDARVERVELELYQSRKERK